MKLVQNYRVALYWPRSIGIEWIQRVEAKQKCRLQRNSFFSLTFFDRFKWFFFSIVCLMWQSYSLIHQHGCYLIHCIDFRQLNLLRLQQQNWFRFFLSLNSNCLYSIIVAIKHAAFLIRFHNLTDDRALCSFPLDTLRTAIENMQ